MKKNIDTNSFKTIEEVENFRKEINEACDERKEVLSLINRANELSSQSFGFIKEAYENLSPELFESKDGRKLLKKYISTIRESADLSKMHRLYESIRKTNKNSDIDFFVNSVSNENWNVNAKSLKEDSKKLGKVLAEAYIILGKDSESILPKNDKTFHNAVEFIAENKKSQKNLSEYSSAVKILREHIEKNEETKNVFVETNFDETVSNMVREFNEKYADKLSEKEIELVKECAKTMNPQELFEKYKNDCGNKILEAKTTFEKNGDTNSVKRLSSIYEQISSKEFSKDTLTEDVCNFIEMSTIFE